MALFYFPLNITIQNIPIIVYPLVGSELVFDRKEHAVIENHLKNLYELNPELTTGNYHIVMVWSDEGDRMTDVWIFSTNESEQSGPLIEARTYRSMKQDTTMGTTAADGLIMLGKETELEERFRKSGKSINEYIHASRPELPEGIMPVTNFYTA